MSQVTFHPAASYRDVLHAQKSVKDTRTVADRVYDVAMAPFRAIYTIYDTIRPQNPLTKERQFHFFPEWLEIALGGYGYRNSIDARGGEWEPSKWRPSGYNHMVNNYKNIVDRGLKRMIPHTGRAHLPWEIKMVDTSTVNAWATLGGKMGINRALIERMGDDKRDFGLGRISREAAIVSIIGHEAAHVAGKHSVRWVEINIVWSILAVLFEPWLLLIVGLNTIENLVSSYYSRSQEFEADRYGMELMWKAGYDPKAAIWAQEFMKDYESKYGIGWMDWLDRLFSSHPSADERIKANKITLAELQTRKRPVLAARAA